MSLMMMHHSSGNILDTPNTFIGGVGATSVTSASDLAALTSLSVGDIDNFQIDAFNNVSCYIGVSYTLDASAFLSDSALTYFHSKNTFSPINNNSIFQNSSIKVATYLGNVVYGYNLFDGSQLTRGYFSEATALGGYRQFASLTNLVRLYFGNIATASDTTTGGNSSFSSTSGAVVYAPNGWASMSASVQTFFNEAVFRGNTVKEVTSFTLPTKATGLNLSETYSTVVILDFSAGTSINIIDFYEIWVDTGNGYEFYSETTSLTDNIITDLPFNTLCKIKIATCDEFWNGSGFNPDETKRVFSDEFSFTTSADEITDLALVTAYGTALKVDWSFSLNSEVDYYEIYVDNVFNKNVSIQEAFITGLALNTSYDIKVRGHYTVGGFTTYSNVLTQSTNASEDIPYGSITSYWKCNGNSNDALGSNNGTDNAMNYVAGLIDDCADFTAGVTSKISVPDANSLSFGNGTIDTDFSFVILVKFDTVGNSWFINKREEINNKEYQLSLFSGNLRWQQFDQSAGGQLQTSTAWSPNTTDWYVLSVSSTAGNQPKIYINSIDSGSANNSGTYFAMENLNQPLIIGKASWNNIFSFDGYMNMLSIFDKAITVTEVSAIVDKLLTDNEHLI